MGVLKEVNFNTLSLNPVSAHREGGLCYHIWSFLSWVVWGLGGLHKLAFQLSSFDADYGRFLYFGRIVNAFVDLLTAVLIYKIASLLCVEKKWSPLFAVSLFLITPFEIIYSHYLRTHTFANFFSMWVLYESIKLYDNPVPAVYRRIGFALGLAIAARYTSICLTFLPVAIWCCVKEKQWKPGAGTALKFILGFLLLGFFVGDPYLFLQYGKAQGPLHFQM